MTESEINITLAILNTLGFCKKEYEFHPDRKWRFDFAFPNEKLAIEVDGGTYSSRTYTNKKGQKVVVQGGRHNSSKGFMGDLEKFNNATKLGWKTLRFTPQQIRTSSALDFIKDVLLQS